MISGSKNKLIGKNRIFLNNLLDESLFSPLSSLRLFALSVVTNRVSKHFRKNSGSNARLTSNAEWVIEKENIIFNTYGQYLPIRLVFLSNRRTFLTKIIKKLKKLKIKSSCVRRIQQTIIFRVKSISFHAYFPQTANSLYQFSFPFNLTSWQQYNSRFSATTIRLFDLFESYARN